MKQNNLSCSYAKRRSLILLILYLLIALNISAQETVETVVVGQVLNKYDKSPLSSVSVYFKNSSIGVQTNEEGYFLIRNKGEETTLVFTLVGYQKKELKLKRGDNVGVQMELEEKQNILSEIFVMPGINPATDLMKKIRLKRQQNNVKVKLKSTEQSAVFLSKNDTRWQNNKLYEQFKTGNLQTNDTSLLVPLYMEESDYDNVGTTKELKNKNTYNTTKTAENLIVQLLKGLDNRINFYDNSVNILGKTMISPLANIGNMYYKYYLTDSLQSPTGKQYDVHFYSKNPKNLAFNGKMRIDSASLALVHITAGLPRQANINFIHNLEFEQTFKLVDIYWIPKTQRSAWDMTYDVLKDNRNTNPELLVSRSTLYADSENALVLLPDSFAGSAYSQETISSRMAALQETKLYKTAKYIADAALTGYMKVGKIDIGQLTTIMRLTEPEGFRIGLPFRTNEDMWKNFMIGGYGAFGFGDKKWKYGAEMQWKLPTVSRFIVGVKYINDYRRTDYDYTDFLWRENPHSTGDYDIVSTIFSFQKGTSLNKRTEFTAFIYKDITPDIETYLIYQNKKILDSEAFPFVNAGSLDNYHALYQQSISFTSRFSFNEHFIDGHFQRFYQKNSYPVIYGTFEAGKYQFSLTNGSGNYARLVASIQQVGNFTLGEWRYFLEAGKIFGTVPYPILKNIKGKNGSIYSRYQFTLMQPNEYMADTYATLQSELMTNGIIFNNIPLIKRLNLREIASFKIAYGSLNENHAKLMNLPAVTSGFTKPYSEVSIGFANLLGIISVQYTRRLTDLDKPTTRKSGLVVSFMLDF